MLCVAVKLLLGFCAEREQSTDYFLSGFYMYLVLQGRDQMLKWVQPKVITSCVVEWTLEHGSVCN